MILRTLLVLFLWSGIAQAQPDITLAGDVCLSKQEYKELLTQVEQLLKVNKDLVDELKRFKSANPKLELDSFSVVIDEDGRVFIKDTIKGKLQIGTLSYDVSVKLKPTILRPRDSIWSFHLKYKAAGIVNYERDENNDVRSYGSAALDIEFFYYKWYNLNLLVGPRLYGPAIGVDITNHFDILTGIGFLYNDTKTFLIGGAFDF